MKKLFLALAIAGALTACNNEGDTKTSGDSTTTNLDSNGGNGTMSTPATDNMNNNNMAPMDSSKTAPMGADSTGVGGRMMADSSSRKNTPR